MKEFKLHPVDPAFTAAASEASEAAMLLSHNIMNAMGEMMDNACKAALVHVATDRMSIEHDGTGMTLMVDGRRTFTVSANTLTEQVTVDGQWHRWPLNHELTKPRDLRL